MIFLLILFFVFLFIIFFSQKTDNTIKKKKKTPENIFIRINNDKDNDIQTYINIQTLDKVILSAPKAKQICKKAYSLYRNGKYKQAYPHLIFLLNHYPDAQDNINIQKALDRNEAGFIAWACFVCLDVMYEDIEKQPEFIKTLNLINKKTPLTTVRIKERINESTKASKA